MANKNAAKDKLHASNLGKVKDINELSYDKESNSYELDFKGDEHRYDHPLPYNTAAPNGEDSLSSYDDANPFLEGDASLQSQLDEQYSENGMRIISDEDELLSSPEDKMLSRTAEDTRDDLDEEGYPTRKPQKK
jgi:hypothetical protein